MQILAISRVLRLRIYFRYVTDRVGVRTRIKVNAQPTFLFIF